MDLSYQKAGVNIPLANQIIKEIKPAIKKTFIPGVIGEIGGFGGLFDLSGQNYKEPVLVSSTDGVGTKLKIAFTLNKHDTIGLDLVAMSVNDILTCGARPLFFLDYISIGKLSNQIVSEIIKGVIAGCMDAGCALLGGETAEMPDIYQDGEYDLAGFALGIVEKSKIIDGKNIKVGDVAIGISSSGLHSNGFSLVRKVLLKDTVYSLDERILGGEKTLGEELLTPTRIYTKPILHLLEKFKILGIAHITGGGLVENIPRILPRGVSIQIDKESWPKPLIFSLLQEKGSISEEEMYLVFNMGIGMILIVRPDIALEVSSTLNQLNYQSYIIGKIIKGEKKVIM